MQMTESPLRPPQPQHDDDAPDQQLPHDEQPESDFGPFELDSPKHVAAGGGRGGIMGRPARLHQSQQQAPLSFANPSDRNRLYEQLSAKMVPIDPKTMLTVSSDEGKGRKVAGAARRSSRSADPSPRWVWAGAGSGSDLVSDNLTSWTELIHNMASELLPLLNDHTETVST